ncbi:acyl-CoA dehydrogenase family protein [Streptomyces sp. KL116D]|uniref:acyl-CoA dehydrogenase family protein n=1 Tax=Streptomyces sp. KL116D TaxID=3045152 RepID=UPI003558F838
MWTSGLLTSRRCCGRQRATSYGTSRPAEKAKEWDEQGIVPAGLFEGMADMGWFSPPFSECGGWGRWRAA